MKKVLTLLLCVLMATLSLTYRIQAEDPCRIVPTDLRIENNTLKWEAEGATKHELRFRKGDEPEQSVQLGNKNEFYIFELIDDVGEYAVSVLSGNDICDFSNVARMTFEIKKIALEEAYNDGMQPYGAGKVSLVEDILYIDTIPDNIEVDFKVNKGYQVTFYNNKLPDQADYISSPIQATDDDIEGSYTLPKDKFDIKGVEEKKVYYLFSTIPLEPVTYTYDLGAGHEKVAKAIADYLEQSEIEFILDGTKIKFNYRPDLELGLFARQAIQATIYALKEGFVDNNEMFALVNVSPDASDLKAVMELIMDESKMAKDYNYTLYALWLKYTGSGGGTWTLDDTGSLDFTFTRNLNDKGIPDGLISTFESFDSLQLDGKEITDYTAKEGSLIVTLSDSVLNKLSVGTHTLTATFNPELFIGEDSDTAINSDTVTASVSFTVKEKEEPKPEPKPTLYVLPKTGVE